MEVPLASFQTILRSSKKKNIPKSDSKNVKASPMNEKQTINDLKEAIKNEIDDVIQVSPIEQNEKITMKDFLKQEINEYNLKETQELRSRKCNCNCHVDGYCTCFNNYINQAKEEQNQEIIPNNQNSEILRSKKTTFNFGKMRNKNEELLKNSMASTYSFKKSSNNLYRNESQNNFNSSNNFNSNYSTMRSTNPRKERRLIDVDWDENKPDTIKYDASLKILAKDRSYL